MILFSLFAFKHFWLISEPKICYIEWNWPVKMMLSLTKAFNVKIKLSNKYWYKKGKLIFVLWKSMKKSILKLKWTGKKPFTFVFLLLCNY